MERQRLVCGLIKCSGNICFFSFFPSKEELRLWHINPFCNEWMNVGAGREITARESLLARMRVQHSDAFPSVWQKHRSTPPSSSAPPLRHPPPPNLPQPSLHGGQKNKEGFKMSWMLIGKPFECGGKGGQKK